MLIIDKAGTELLRLEDNGDVTFNARYEEDHPTSAARAELAIATGSGEQLASALIGSERITRLARRLHDNAVLPHAGLQFIHGREAQAELHPSGDLYVRGVRRGNLDNPAQPGALAFDPIVYAAQGLSYGSDLGPQYAVFEAPSAGYETRTIDLSAFAELSSFVGWPFPNTAVPINGLLRIPQGPGPFPLAVFVHGNHSPFENSTPGYVYLLELLASHGIIAASVDCNFLNGFNFGENDGRAIVQLEHVRQFKLWNETPGHPLYQRVAIDRIMIVGHSRGGEGVSHASHFNALTSYAPDPGGPLVPLDGTLGLGPYQFALRAVVAIAPTDLQYQPPDGPAAVRDAYFVVHGSRDGDVVTFEGQRTYDRAHKLDLANPTQPAAATKALLWVIGANHNFFNSVWGGEGSPTLSRAEQELVAKVWIGAIARSRLLGHSAYEDMLRDHHLASNQGWLPSSISLVSQFQDLERRFIDHFEQADPAHPSPPLTGTITTTGMSSAELQLDSGPFGELFQETRGLQLAWSAAGGRYAIETTAAIARGVLQQLVLRAGQGDDPLNDQATLQDFAITLSDENRSHTLRASEHAQLAYPAELDTGTKRVVLQTLRVPLRKFADHGVDIDRLRKIELAFDEPQLGTSKVSGKLYLDEIQLSE